jgi:hypothetical protein
LKAADFCEDKSCMVTIKRISFHKEDLPENLKTMTLGSLMVCPKEYPIPGSILLGLALRLPGLALDLKAFFCHHQVKAFKKN